jgi:iron complex outermembrane receptor protein
MAGVVNLVSRRPGAEPSAEVLVNRSTRGATDAVLFGAVPLSGRWRMSLLGGGHWQALTDVDDDGWGDLPEYARGVVRPRLFWDGGGGRTFFGTIGATYESRRGGSMPGRPLAATGAPSREALDTVRLDGGASAQLLFRGRYVLTARAAFNRQRHDHRFGGIRERDRHRTGFGEVAVRGAAGAHTWVAGAALEHEVYVPRDLPQWAYTFTVPGVFAQDDITVSDWLSVSASVRLDHHSTYGTFASPRISALIRGDRGWALRASAGTGFFGPSWLTEETEAAGLSRLTVPRPLVAERGRSASLDLTRVMGPAAVTVTGFVSRILHPIDVDRSGGLVMTNAASPTTNAGVELLATVRREPFALTGTYTFVDARESDAGGRAMVPLTPRHSAGAVGMIESEDTGRLGLEVYYTGAQRLELNPYRNMSRPYVIVGALAERRFGRVRLFLNAENLTGVRQTRWDPLLRAAPSSDGRWTVDAWAPLEGRVFNGGVRLGF